MLFLLRLLYSQRLAFRPWLFALILTFCLFSSVIGGDSVNLLLIHCAKLSLVKLSHDLQEGPGSVERTVQLNPRP